MKKAVSYFPSMEHTLSRVISGQGSNSCYPLSLASDASIESRVTQRHKADRSEAGPWEAVIWNIVPYQERHIYLSTVTMYFEIKFLGALHISSNSPSPNLRKKVCISFALFG